MCRSHHRASSTACRGQAVKHRDLRHPRPRPGIQHGEVLVGQQPGHGDGDDLAAGAGQPDNRPGYPDHHLVPAAGPDPVPDAELTRPPGHRAPPGSRAGDDKGLRGQPDRQVRGQLMPPHQVEQDRQDRHRITGGGSPGHQRGRLGEDLLQEAGQARRAAASRVTVPCQPRNVRRQHRIRDAHPPEAPPGQPARVLRGVERLRVFSLDPVIGTHVDDNAGAIGHPGEQVRRVTPGPASIITPAQPERLRREHGDLRVEVQQHHMITLKPGLVPDMRPGGRRPPQARQMLLASGPPELPDRHECLRPQPRPCSRQLAALSPARVEITQLELRVSVPGPCRLALPHRSRSVSCGHIVRKL